MFFLRLVTFTTQPIFCTCLRVLVMFKCSVEAIIVKNSVQPCLSYLVWTHCIKFVTDRLRSVNTDEDSILYTSIFDLILFDLIKFDSNQISTSFF